MDQPYQQKGGQPLPTAKGPATVPSATLNDTQQMFLTHKHDGSILGGGYLYGPYFIKDSVTMQIKKLVLINGVLGVQ